MVDKYDHAAWLKCQLMPNNYLESRQCNVGELHRTYLSAFFVPGEEKEKEKEK